MKTITCGILFGCVLLFLQHVAVTGFMPHYLSNTPRRVPRKQQRRRMDFSAISATEAAQEICNQCACGAPFDAYRYAVAGAVAGGCRALSRSLTFPFDTMKTFAQASSSTANGKETKENTANDNSIPRENYYKGSVIALASAVPANALFFIIYNALEYYFPCSSMNNIGTITTITASTSGRLIERISFSAIATLFQNSVKIPSEVIKQRAQLSVGDEQSTALSVAAGIVKEEGVKGLYAGASAQLLREIPYNAFQMSLFELFQDASVHQEMLQSMDSSVLSATLGFTAASIAAILTQPADVIKTRMMMKPISSKEVEIHSCSDKFTDVPDTRKLDEENFSYEPTDYLRNNDDHSTSTGLLLEERSRVKKVVTSAPALPHSAEANKIQKSEQGITFSEAVKEVYRSGGWRAFFIGLKPRLVIVSIGGLVYFYTAALVNGV